MTTQIDKSLNLKKNTQAMHLLKKHKSTPLLTTVSQTKILDLKTEHFMWINYSNVCCMMGLVPFFSPNKVADYDATFKMETHSLFELLHFLKAHSHEQDIFDKSDIEYLFEKTFYFGLRCNTLF